jgi:hypothetical protein
MFAPRWYTDAQHARCIETQTTMHARSVLETPQGPQSHHDLSRMDCTVTVTIPASTPLNTYFLLGCADDQNARHGDRHANNWVATPAATVTVTRSDLVQDTVSAPPTTKTRGTSFTTSDTVRNRGSGVRRVDNALLPLPRSG